MTTPPAAAPPEKEGAPPLPARRSKILLIAGGELFPNGTGATARLRAYALGLSRCGADVRVSLLVSMPPESWPDPDTVASGEWRGIPYEYMSGVAAGERGWLRRRTSEVRAVRRTCADIVRAGRQGDPAAVVLIAGSLRWLLPVTAACRWARIPVVHDRTEHPFVYCGETGFWGTLYRRIYVANVFRLFDGVVVISTRLEEHLRPRIRRGAWMLRVPILVDAGDFDCPKDPEHGLVGYAGNLGHPEEIDALIEAAAIVRSDHPATRVRVVGGGSAAEVAIVKSAAERLGMMDAVELVGPVPADRVPGQLCECSALALPRASGLFSSAGMPTKLGEYLATGRPVVVTATGDIPLYLHHGVDAFVIEPGEPRSLASALAAALYDEESAKVGRAGRELARREFDPTAHMRALLEKLAGDGGGDRT